MASYTWTCLWWKSASTLQERLFATSSTGFFQPTHFSQAFKSEKGKRWEPSGTWGKPSSQKVHPPGQWGKVFGAKLSLWRGFFGTFRSFPAALKEGRENVWGGFSGLDDFERCLGCGVVVPENSSSAARPHDTAARVQTSKSLHAAFTVSWDQKKSQNGLQPLYSSNVSAHF